MKMYLNDFKELTMADLLSVNGGYTVTTNGYSTSGGTGSYASAGGTGSYPTAGGTGSYSAYSATTPTGTPHSTVPEGYSPTSGWLPGWGPDGYNGTDQDEPVAPCNPAAPSAPNNPVAPPVYQTPTNPNDYHCDINSYNVAVDQGMQNPGTWDGNALTVNQIYTQNYGNGAAAPQAGTQGYGFMDNNGDGTYDHMFYYSYEGGGTYQVWNSPGNTPVTQTEWSINGTAVQQSVFVPLN